VNKKKKLSSAGCTLSNQYNTVFLFIFFFLVAKKEKISAEKRKRT